MTNRRQWVTGFGAALVAIGMHGSATADEDLPEDPAIRKANAEIELEKANKLASRGKLADAIPHYKRAIVLDPLGQRLAYYNLAEVQKVAGNCEDAVPYYHFYERLSGTEAAAAEVAASLKGCKTEGWPKLHVKLRPKVDGTVYINGVMASPDGEFGPVAMPAGEYSIELQAVDHHPQSRTVKLLTDDATLDVQLEKMTFFGTIRVNVEPAKANATIKIYKGPSDATDLVTDTSEPMEEPVKVHEGRHFIEVTADGYNRWIRNVTVGRDDKAVVNVALTRSKPKELE